MVLRIHSIAHWCYLHRVPVIPRFLKAVTFALFGAVLPPECTIGRGTRLHHHALSVILHSDTEIGRDCNIYNQVLIGGAHDGPDGPPIRIVIGDRVTVGAGAKVLCKAGTLTIGEGSTVGANAVVLSDIPPNSLALGIPARCVPKKRQPAAA